MRRTSRMIRRATLRWLAVGVVGGLIARAASAQRPVTVSASLGPPPGTPPGEVMPDAAATESLAVLRKLDATVRSSGREAATWYRRGMVAWGLMYRGLIGPNRRDIDWTLLARSADSSLRTAVSIDGKNPRYILSAAQFFLGTGPMTMRVQSYPMFAKAYDLTRTIADTALRAEAAIEYGRLSWRRYDALANRRIDTDSGATLRSITGDTNRIAQALAGGRDIPQNVGKVVQRINASTTPLPFELSGASDYLNAEQLFREACATSPTNDRAFRELAMVFAERKRWTELASLAHDRIQQNRRDGYAWLALGLAMQRSRKYEAAAAAFDTGLTALSPRERAYLTRLERVIPPQDSMSYGTRSQAEKARDIASYWLFADPLWSRGGNDAYTEFLARVTYADIRWTVEELGVRGIDSDRGLFYVRYGPPTVEAALGPKPDRNELGGSLSDFSQFGSDKGAFTDQAVPLNGGSNEMFDRTTVATIWAYDTGWLIIFRGWPTYATSHIAPEDGAVADSLMRASPALWKNVGDETIRDMPTQVARFRGGHDSVDVLVSTEPPVTEIREAAGTNAPIRADFWVFGRDNPGAFRDSTRLTTGDAHAWRYRVAPAHYAYRIETTADGSMIAGRATDWIDASASATTGFTTRGFGISDVLIANSAEDRPDARRWTDFDIAPSGGTVAKGGKVALIWEDYDLTPRDGTATWDITVTLQRKYKEALNRIRARIAGTFAAMAGVDRTEDRVVYRFERSGPGLPIIADLLTIELEDTPPGDYILTLEITDRATGQSVERTQRFTIRE